MFFRILKKDLKRKKVMNTVLLSFILLATMFVAGGITNVAAVMNGTDSYMDKAGIGDYVVISMGKDSKNKMEAVLHDEKEDPRQLPELLVLDGAGLQRLRLFLEKTLI